MKTLFILIFLININTSFSQLPPTLLPGYPLVVDSTQGTYNSGASPIVADFNNDGENEILICVNLDLLTGSVYLMDIHGNVKPNFPIEVSCINSYMNSAVGDVDGDGFLDIVVKADSLYVFEF
ncbi:MAG: VCBS repeat-containing protein [Ignavibacteria bacterium]